VHSLKKKTLDQCSKGCILIGYGSGKIDRHLIKTTRNLAIARAIKFDETLLGFGNFGNKAVPLHILDGDDKEDKRESQALTEDVKEPFGKKPALEKTKEMQLVLR